MQLININSSAHIGLPSNATVCALKEGGVQVTGYTKYFKEFNL